MAKIAHHRITRKIAEEIRSLAKEHAATPKQLVSLYIQPESERWLMILAQKLEVKRGEIVHYFLKKLGKKFPFEKEKYEALIRIRAQNSHSQKLVPIYLPAYNADRPPGILEVITSKAEGIGVERALLMNMALIRSIKE